ncbi:MAG: hypothetical protein LBQ15_10985 [Clostridium sp.]|nr:hypothetical protein [Clostridium sp.]
MREWLRRHPKINNCRPLIRMYYLYCIAGWAVADAKYRRLERKEERR